MTETHQKVHGQYGHHNQEQHKDQISDRRMRNNLRIADTILAEVLRKNTVEFKLADHHDARLQDSPAHIAEPGITINEHVKR